MDNQQERLIELSWLAGLIEGDGYFVLHRQKMKNGKQSFQPAIGFVNSDELLIDEVIRILDLNKIPYHITKREQKGYGTKPIYQLVCQGMKRSYKLIPALLPFLKGVKRKRAELIVQFIEYRFSKIRTAPYAEYEENIYREFDKLRDKPLLKSSTTIR